MGPAEFRASRDFWATAAERVSVYGVRIRPRERLCAVALTKRFAGPTQLASELGVKAEDLRFPDTSTVAAREWLVRTGIDPEAERRRGSGYWSGLWLHWGRRDEEDEDERRKPDEDLWRRIREAREPCRHGPPPVYYAVLAMDGDEMGRWLAGAKTPELRKLLHPKLRGYFEGLDDARVEEGLHARRPVGPALHAAISAALSTFASEVAPQVVRDHHGTLIYSGGDDVLALCPVVTALACANALRDAFSGRDDPAGDGWRTCGDRRRMTMGERASMSAGLAVVHYHDDLRIALETARAAKDGAKRAGRDCVCLMTARRSGETASAICPWSCVPWFDALRLKFAKGTSDRWTYRLRAELPTLTSGLLPIPAMQSEIRRLVVRSHGEGDGGTLRGDEVADAFGRYRSARGNSTDGEALRDFVTSHNRRPSWGGAGMVEVRRAAPPRTVSYDLEPLDVLFFRDGRPFDAAPRATTTAGAPMPQTVAGALRTWLLSRMGADFAALGVAIKRGASFSAASAAQGQKAGAVGRLGVRGPWFVRNGERLVPTPATIEVEKDAEEPHRLHRLDPGGRRSSGVVATVGRHASTLAAQPRRHPGAGRLSLSDGPRTVPGRRRSASRRDRQW